MPPRRLPAAAAAALLALLVSAPLLAAADHVDDDDDHLKLDGSCDGIPGATMHGSSCLCDIGYTMEGGDGACVACPEGTFTSVPGVEACLSCTMLFGGDFVVRDDHSGCGCPRNTLLVSDEPAVCAACPPGTGRDEAGHRHRECVTVTAPGIVEPVPCGCAHLDHAAVSDSRSVGLTFTPGPCL